MKRLELDQYSPLGTGAFGIVLKAQLKPVVNAETSDNHNLMTVAVKTLPENADVMYFKALRAFGTKNLKLYREPC